MSCSMTLPDPTVTVRQMGREGEPLVIIDGFSGMVGELLDAAYAATYQHAGASAAVDTARIAADSNRCTDWRETIHAGGE